MDFDGERIIPELNNYFFREHLTRYRFARDYLDSRKTHLDVGCGDGYGAFYLSHSARNTVGIDIASDVIISAREKYRRVNLEFVQIPPSPDNPADPLSQWVLPEKDFDLITMFEVFEHVRNPGALIQQIQWALSSSGLAIISTPNVDVFGANLPVPFHVKEYRLEEFVGIVEKYLKIDTVLGQRSLHPIAKKLNFFMSRQAMKFPIVLRSLNWILHRRMIDFSNLNFINRIDTTGFSISPEDPATADYFIIVGRRK